jgi:hypothetical protein
MTSRRWYFLAGFGSAVALYLFLWGLGLLANSLLSDIFGARRSDVQISEALESPNGEYTATEYVAMGGGAAGWCSRRVTVNSKAWPFSWEKERERGGYSFSVNCSSEVDLKWEDNRHLIVGYARSDDKDTISMSQSPLSFDETVQIRYVAR